MIATTAVSTAPIRLRRTECDRHWCDHGGGCADGFHQHAISPAWQQHPGGPSVSLALEDHEDDDFGTPTVAISYSRDGEIADGCVTLPLTRARELAYSLLQAIACAENTPTRSATA